MPFTLLTYNVDYANRDVAASLDAIAAADAEVVLLQEISATWQRALEQRFATAYPHHAYRLHRRGSGGLATLSKLPITDEALLPPPERWFPAQRLTIATPDGPVQLLNVHLRPAIAQGSWVKGYLTTPPIRRREMVAFWHQLERPLPTLVAGDFNETARGQAVGFLAERGLQRVATAGPTTWHHVMTIGGRAVDLLRLDIDHVMLDGQLAASDARVLDTGTSDHRPVAMTIHPRPGVVSGA